MLLPIFAKAAHFDWYPVKTLDPGYPKLRSSRRLNYCAWGGMLSGRWLHLRRTEGRRCLQNFIEFAYLSAIVVLREMAIAVQSVAAT